MKDNIMRTPEELFRIMDEYEIIDRKVIKANLVKVYRKHGFKNKKVVEELDMAKTKVNFWTTMCMPNIPTFYDAMRLAVHFGFDIEKLLEV